MLELPPQQREYFPLTGHKKGVISANDRLKKEDRVTILFNKNPSRFYGSSSFSIMSVKFRAKWFSPSSSCTKFTRPSFQRISEGQLLNSCSF